MFSAMRQDGQTTRQAHEALSVQQQGPLHGVDIAWLPMQAEQLESYIYEPKTGNPNND